MTFGARLRTLRLSRGLTQEELAEHLHLSKACINRYELDKREPAFASIRFLADFFNTDFNFLLGMTNNASTQETIDLELIQKFHALDDRGKAAVLNTLEHEYSCITK